MQRLTGELICAALPVVPPEGARWPETGDARRALLRGLAALAPERLLLSTCERFEIHAVSPAGTAEWNAFLAGALGLPRGTAIAWRRGDDAARHLLRVAAGLESRLAGEPQIQAQVRRALAEARGERALGALLGRLVSTSLHTGRRVRCETALGGAGGSLVALATARLEEQLGTLQGRRVGLAGTGALAGEIACGLALRGARIVVTSRQPARAAVFAARHRGAVAVRALRLRDLDALVTCTRGAVALDAAAELPVMDLGSPPNVPHPAPGVRLTRLRDLRAAGVPGGDLRAAAEIVGEELHGFLTWHRQRAAAADVAALVREATGGGERLPPAERRALHERIRHLKQRAA